MTITPITYSIDGSDRVYIEKHGAKWVVANICSRSLLNKHNRWEWETYPPNRTDEFKQRVGFSSPEEALQAYEEFTQILP